MRQPFLLALVLGIIALPATPAAAEDLERIMLIGESPEGEDTVAKALLRHIVMDNMGILVTTLKEVVPGRLPEDQFDDLREAAIVLRDQAQHWLEAGIHHKKGLALTQVIYDIADSVRTRKSDHVDAQLAYANALVALTFERKNRRSGIKFDETFGAAAKTCIEAAALDKTRDAQCRVQEATLLRMGAKYAGTAEIETLGLALKQLESIEGDEDLSLLTAKARVFLARAFAFLRGKKKKDARDAQATGSALLASKLTSAGPPSNADFLGAMNDLHDLGISNKWSPKDTPLQAESIEKGGFSINVPIGTGWHDGNAGNLKGKGRFLLERRHPDGTWNQIGIAAFSAELTYGEGDVSGAKPKAILGLTKQVWSGTMKKPKSGSASKKLVPKGLKCVDSYSLSGRNRAGVPQSVFAWACTGASKEWMYVITVVVRGKTTKKLPLQAERMLASIKELAE